MRKMKAAPHSGPSKNPVAVALVVGTWAVLLGLAFLPLAGFLGMVALWHAIIAYPHHREQQRRAAIAADRARRRYNTQVLRDWS